MDPTSSSSSLLIHIPQVVGIFSSAFFAGCGITFSLATVPAILQSPTTPVLLQQWRTVFRTGATIGPPLALLAFLNCGWVAWLKYHQSQSSNSIMNEGSVSEWKAYAFCGIATVAIVPFTVLIMGGTNGKLLAASTSGANEDAETLLKLKDGQVRELVRKWGMLNVVRCCFPILGTLVVLWVALK